MIEDEGEREKMKVTKVSFERAKRTAGEEKNLSEKRSLNGVGGDWDNIVRLSHREKEEGGGGGRGGRKSWLNHGLVLEQKGDLLVK